MKNRRKVANLLNNAVKFTEQGRIVLALSVRQREDAKVAFDLSIQDTGIGIPLSAQARIFEHFAQADGSTSRKYGGTGLGLAICRRLVEMMGGRISVLSAPGEGATGAGILRVTGLDKRYAGPSPLVAETRISLSLGLTRRALASARSASNCR